MPGPADCGARGLEVEEGGRFEAGFPAAAADAFVVRPAALVVPSLPAGFFARPAGFFALPADFFALPAGFFALPAGFFALPADFFALPAGFFALPVALFGGLPLPAGFFVSTRAEGFIAVRSLPVAAV